MKKVDYKREFSALFKASDKRVDQVEVPPLNYLMIDGCGDPNQSAEFHQAIEALYALAYAIKFMVKRSETAIDYGVMPLQGLWWANDMAAFKTGDKANWQWTLMIMQPEIVTKESIRQATAQVANKKNPKALPLVRFELLKEGVAMQTLHVGPYTEEGPSIERLHAAIEQNGATRRGKHHEIYLNDPRRSAPERLKTIIRQPIE